MSSADKESQQLGNNVLDEIIAHKRQEVAAKQSARPTDDLIAALKEAPIVRDFEQALRARIEGGDAAVIAEIKRASPSKGLIREDFDPVAIAKSYERGGAACLSVLTDEKYFQGHDDFLIAARNACRLPVIRKDFIVSPYQVYESRLLGADCILLIVACLNDEELDTLASLASKLGMDVLVEVHDRVELERALRLRLPLVGVNNRDLRRFVTDIETTIGLLGDVPSDRLVITESGIHNKKDIELLRSHRVNAFLVGEAFMRADDPGAELRSLFFT
ncbi:MAG: indole-3-glycerol phosphate synthase TrpC [Gammaproteobacteria bacterium]